MNPNVAGVKTTGKVERGLRNLKSVSILDRNQSSLLDSGKLIINETPLKIMKNCHC